MNNGMDSNLRQALKELIISVCDLETIDITPDKIKDDEILVGPDSSIGIDSLDAIEIVAAIEKKYGVRINNIDTAQRVLKSIATLADFIQEKHQESVTV